MFLAAYDKEDPVAIEEEISILLKGLNVLLQKTNVLLDLILEKPDVLWVLQM